MAWKHPLEGLRFGMSDQQRQVMDREIGQMNVMITIARFIVWIACPVAVISYWMSR